jgi:hypothetical protein
VLPCLVSTGASARSSATREVAQVITPCHPRYRLRGSAMGSPAFGSGMTFPLVVDDPGGGVTGPGGIDVPLMSGLGTGFTRAGRALRNVGVAVRCRGKADVSVMEGRART